MPATQPYRQLDFSGGVQSASSRLLKKSNELASGTKNATFVKKIGSVARRDGYEQVGNTITGGKDGLGATVYRYGTNNKIIVAMNNGNDSTTALQYLDSASNWTNILNTTNPNTRMNFLNYLDELYVAGFSTSHGNYTTLRNIDGTLTASTTRNVLNAPQCKLVTEFQGSVYAINCVVNGVKYKDRAYKSSAPTGAITFVQGDQGGGLLLQLAVDSVRYLKPGMTVDIYGGGSENLKFGGLQIVSVDKVNNRISFTQQNIYVKDNDEIWLSGRKGKLSILWNTDYPTPESSDFLRVPPGKEDNPEFTAYGKNNNRLLLFTLNSVLKWDGANFVTISDKIGCVSQETVQNIGSWTLWLHYTGVWGYNDSTGEIRLFSRKIDNFIKAINQTNFPKASAVASGNIYKLAVGQIATLDSATTSTSTSSTSTSSTSSSTSSTSTSSTSTSSTSSSTSTSSTSSSTSSTSSSTSSTSTSTTTATGSVARQILRLVYDFDSNNWSPEYHTREIRFQFNHTMNAYTKPYFLDDTGKLFRDETTNTDAGDTISFEVELGRNNFGTPYVKKYSTTFVYSDKATNAQILASINGQQFRNIGEVDQDTQKIVFPPEFNEGRDINYKFTHNDSGEAPIIDGIETYYSAQEASYA